MACKTLNPTILTLVCFMLLLLCCCRHNKWPPPCNVIGSIRDTHHDCRNVACAAIGRAPHQCCCVPRSLATIPGYIFLCQPRTLPEKKRQPAGSVWHACVQGLMCMWQIYICPWGDLKCLRIYRQPCIPAQNYVQYLTGTLVVSIDCSGIIGVCQRQHT